MPGTGTVPSASSPVTSPETGGPSRKLPHPLLRAVLYLAACLGAAVIGLVPTGAIIVAWMLARYGDVSEALVRREAGIDSMASVFGIYPAVIAATLLFVRFVERGTLSRVGLTGRSWLRAMASGMVIGAGFAGVSMLLYVALGWVRLVPTPAPVGMMLALAVMCLLIGFTEELVFRGYLLSVFEEWHGRAFAIAVTSILFWLMHLGQGNVAQPLGAGDMLATGITLALCRYASGALWLSIGLHAAYDWLALSLGGAPEMGLPTLCRVDVKVPTWLVGGPGYAGVADLALGLAFLGCVYWFLYRPSLARSDAMLSPTA